MNIIFLDFDGVMDTASYDAFLISNDMPECDENGRPIFDPDCIHNLGRIIAATGADVVVTSDWKYYDSYEALLSMWRQRAMPGFMTDMTPNVSTRRGDEIARWLAECDVDCNYVIIDDLDSENFNDNQIPHLVTVDPRHGLDDRAVRQAIAILKTPH